MAGAVRTAAVLLAFAALIAQASADCSIKSPGVALACVEESDGSRCTLSCISGYVPTGTDETVTVDCVNDDLVGVPKDFGCAPVGGCNAPPNVANSDGAPNCVGSDFDDVCTYSCKAGFLRAGPSAILCLNTHRWSQAPRCVDPDGCQDHNCDQAKAVCVDVLGDADEDGKKFRCECKFGLTGPPGETGGDCSKVSVAASEEGLALTARQDADIKMQIGGPEGGTTGSVRDIDARLQDLNAEDGVPAATRATLEGLSDDDMATLAAELSDALATLAAETAAQTANAEQAALLRTDALTHARDAGAYRSRAEGVADDVADSVGQGEADLGEVQERLAELRVAVQGVLRASGAERTALGNKQTDLRAVVDDLLDEPDEGHNQRRTELPASVAAAIAEEVQKEADRSQGARDAIADGVDELEEGLQEERDAIAARAELTQLKDTVTKYKEMVACEQDVFKTFKEGKCVDKYGPIESFAASYTADKPMTAYNTWVKIGGTFSLEGKGLFQQGTGFNPATGIFKAPTAGNYYFIGFVGGKDVSSTWQALLTKNGVSTTSNGGWALNARTNNGHDMLEVDNYMKLAANDEVQMQVYVHSDASWQLSSLTYFAGFRVSDPASSQPAGLIRMTNSYSNYGYQYSYNYQWTPIVNEGNTHSGNYLYHRKDSRYMITTYRQYFYNYDTYVPSYMYTEMGFNNNFQASSSGAGYYISSQSTRSVVRSISSVIRQPENYYISYRTYQYYRYYQRYYYYYRTQSPTTMMAFAPNQDFAGLASFYAGVSSRITFNNQWMIYNGWRWTYTSSNIPMHSEPATAMSTSGYKAPFSGLYYCVAMVRAYALDYNGGSLSFAVNGLLTGPESREETYEGTSYRGMLIRALIPAEKDQVIQLYGRSSSDTSWYIDSSYGHMSGVLIGPYDFS